ELAEFFGEIDPRTHRTRHRDRFPSARGHRVLSLEAIVAPARGRASRSVETVQLLAIPQNAERIAANTVAGRLDNRQRDRRRKYRVNGVAAFEHHAQPGLRRERLGGRDHIAREHRHALRRIRKLPLKGFHDGWVSGGKRKLYVEVMKQSD